MYLWHTLKEIKFRKFKFLAKVVDNAMLTITKEQEKDFGHSFGC